ncbi:MAG: serine protease [Proteobacteria bacterium]|nr:serine protease [Pseudomonadota bacterium]
MNTRKLKNDYFLLLAVVLSLSLVPTGCGAFNRQSSAPSRVLNNHEKIIGANDLVSVDANGENIPERLRGILDAIGQLSTGCTAAHIGNGLVLTAGHCIVVSPRSSSGSCRLIAVVWGNRKGNPKQSISKCETVLARNYTAAADYALLKVSTPPAAAITPDFQIPASTARLTMLSFPRMRPLEWSGFCEPSEHTNPDLRDRKFFHSCDSEGGSSGAPLIDEASLKITGIHAGSADDFNYGFYLSAMRDIQSIIDNRK